MSMMWPILHCSDMHLFSIQVLMGSQWSQSCNKMTTLCQKDYLWIVMCPTFGASSAGASAAAVVTEARPAKVRDPAANIPAASFHPDTPWGLLLWWSMAAGLRDD